MNRLSLHTVAAWVITGVALTGIALAHTKSDQANDDTTGERFYLPLQTRGTRAWAQSFVPADNSVGAVDVLLGPPTGPLENCATGGLSVTVEIMDSAFTILGMTTQTVSRPGPDSFWEHFDFASAIYVRAGELHYVHVYGYDPPPFYCAPTASFSNDRYPDGHIWQFTDGIPNSVQPGWTHDFDMFFRTYGPGGTGSTKAGTLEGSGVPGRGIPLAPGLDKAFNENSSAAERAGRKKP